MDMIYMEKRCKMLDTGRKAAELSADLAMCAHEIL